MALLQIFAMLLCMIMKYYSLKRKEMYAIYWG